MNRPHTRPLPQARTGSSLIATVVSAVAVCLLFFLDTDLLLFYGLLCFLAVVMLNKGYVLIPHLMISLKDVRTGNLIFYTLLAGTLLTAIFAGLYSEGFLDAMIVLSGVTALWTVIAYIRAYRRYSVRKRHAETE